LINFFVYIKRRLRTADKDFTGIQPKYKVLSKGKEKIRKILLKKIINFIQLPKDNNYVYYPLHLEPEASTLYWAPFYFENQMAIAENIAKALPLGWYLYIKENPKMFGKRGISFYLYLKRFSNIKFISANLSGIDLIKKSKAVVTITGTSSLEAAFMGKPSFIFGDVFFDACPGVYRIKQWEGAREFIKRKIENFRYDEDRLIRFTWAYLNSLDKGMFCPPDKYPSVLNKENISNLTNALLKNI
jgi:capsule polysaccharide modification protein KpsS